MVAQKAYAYVLRTGSGGAEVIVFTHRDFPEAGVQVPKGSIEPGETPAAAAVREVAEEVGLRGLVLLGQVGSDRWRDAAGNEQERHFFAFAAPADAPDAWEHQVRSAGEDDGLVFCCAFVPVAEAARTLIHGHADVLAPAASLLTKGQGYLFAPLAPSDSAEIATWRYSGTYSVYSLGGDPEDPDEDASEMLDARSPYFAVRDTAGDLVGFFAYGTAAEPWGHPQPALYANADKMLAVGLGMRPDLTGGGLGLPFVRAGLAFALARFAPASFHLYVYPWNQRAIQVYERAGFIRTGMLSMGSAFGERVFLEMRRPALG